MIIKKNSTILLLLLSMGSILPVELDGSLPIDVFFKSIENGWNSFLGSPAVLFEQAQAWITANPKSTGAIVGVVLFSTLALMWQKSVNRRIEQESQEAFQKGLEQGYCYAHAESEERAKHELRAAKIDSFYEGWIDGNQADCKICTATADKHVEKEQDESITYYASAENGLEIEQFLTELFELLKTEGMQECELRMRSDDLEVIVNLQV